MPALPPPLILAGAMLAAVSPAPAQQRIWTVPGTSGATFEAIHWDPASGNVLATRGHQVVRIEPVRGSCRVVAEKRWEAPQPGDMRPGPDLSSLALGPEGTLVLGTNDTHGQLRESMVYRCAGEDQGWSVQAMAGKPHDWTFHSDAWDARHAGLEPMGLAAGPGGTVFVADHINGRVHLLNPWPGAGASAGGHSLQAIAGSGIPFSPLTRDRSIFNAVVAANRHNALKVPLEPVAIAVTSDGAVLVADILHRRVFQLVPRTGSESGTWALEVAAGTGEWGAGEMGHDDARETNLDLPHRLAAGMAGQAYVLTSSRLWELSPNPGTEGSRRWRSRLVSTLSADMTTAPDGSPAARLPQSFFSHPRGMAAGPGGGLLVSVPGEGIRYLGPASGDDALAERVRAYRQAEAAQDGTGMQAIRDALVRQRDEPVAKVFDRPLGFLAHQPAFDRQAGARPGLPAVLRREIGSWVMDPTLFHFRAALALEAIRAGSSAEPVR